MEVKPITALLFIGGIAGAVLTLTDAYDRINDWIFPENISLKGLELCLHDQCLADNETFIDNVSKAVGRTVEADFRLDIPLGIGDYNARCNDKNPYLYAPEERFFIPVDFSKCDTQNGMVFEISSKDYIEINGTTFSNQIRVKGSFTIGQVGPEPRITFTKE